MCEIELEMQKCISLIQTKTPSQYFRTISGTICSHVVRVPKQNNKPQIIMKFSSEKYIRLGPPGEQ